MSRGNSRAKFPKLSANPYQPSNRPGPTRFRGEQVKHLRAAGKLSDETIDARAFAILRLVQRAVRASIETVRNNTAPEVGRDDESDKDLNRKAATDSIVLLKNTAGVLPVDKTKVKKVLVTGPNAKTRTVSGGGSALLTSLYVVTPLEGIKAAFKGQQVEVVYSPGCYGNVYNPMMDGWMKDENGGSGWMTRWYHEEPTEGMEPAEVVSLPGSRMRINDDKPKSEFSANPSHRISVI